MVRYGSALLTMALGGALLASACCSGAQLQQAIVFASQRDGNWEVYRMGGSGGSQTRLTNHRTNDREVRWSPDGSTLLFASDRDGNWEIYSMPATGGPRIAFSRRTAPGKCDLWLMDRGGRYQRPLAQSPEDDTAPAWSPDGQWLAYMGARNQHFQIYKVRPDGQLKQLTSDPPGAVDPCWSPDGKWLAFMSGRTGDRGVYKMRADGTAQTRLIRAAGVDRHPQWSPDGREIAFVSDRGGNSEIYSIGPDGTGERNLPRHPMVDVGPGDQPTVSTWSSSATVTATTRSV